MCPGLEQKEERTGEAEQQVGRRQTGRILKVEFCYSWNFVLLLFVYDYNCYCSYSYLGCHENSFRLQRQGGHLWEVCRHALPWPFVRATGHKATPALVFAPRPHWTYLQPLSFPTSPSVPSSVSALPTTGNWGKKTIKHLDSISESAKH